MTWLDSHSKESCIGIFKDNDKNRSSSLQPLWTHSCLVIPNMWEVRQSSSLNRKLKFFFSSPPPRKLKISFFWRVSFHINIYVWWYRTFSQWQWASLPWTGHAEQKIQHVQLGHIAKTSGVTEQPTPAPQEHKSSVALFLYNQLQVPTTNVQIEFWNHQTAEKWPCYLRNTAWNLHS